MVAKQIDLPHVAATVAASRYKRGRAFYSEGRCSDPSNDYPERLPSNLPQHHYNALIWIEAFLIDLRKQRRRFRSEIAKLQLLSAQPTPIRGEATLPKCIMDKTQSKSPKVSLKRRNSRKEKCRQKV